MYGSPEQFIARARHAAAQGKACPVTVSCLDCLGDKPMCAACTVAALDWVQTLAALFPDGVDIEGAKSQRALVEDMDVSVRGMQGLSRLSSRQSQSQP